MRGLFQDYGMASVGKGGGSHDSAVQQEPKKAQEFHRLHQRYQEIDQLQTS